jgi:hypothetical protein
MVPEKLFDEKGDEKSRDTVPLTLSKVNDLPSGRR